MEKTGSRTIIITGPESTGKTSIAASLTAHYKGTLIPEYAREYVTDLNHAYTYQDILSIADWQYNQMKKMRKDRSGSLFIFDTYLIITKIWLIWFSGKYPSWIDDALLETCGSLYLLCSTDIEWVPDGIRENGGEARERLFSEYKRELEKFKLNFKIIDGFNDNRISHAIAYVDEYLKNDGKKI